MMKLVLRKECKFKLKKEKRFDSNGVFNPSGLSPRRKIFFAIDYVDLKIDTLDGKAWCPGKQLPRDTKINKTIQPQSL